MDLELSKMKDLNCHIENLRSRLQKFNQEELEEKKNKIKQLALLHRAKGNLTLEELDKNIEEIEKINEEIKTAEAIKKEIEEKEKELNEIRNKSSYFTQQSTGGDFKINMRDENQKVDIRQAFTKYLLRASYKDKNLPNISVADLELSQKEAKSLFTISELRALGVATTTTSTTFSEPTIDTNGINNGGLFIPERMALDILKEEEIFSPIYRDVRTTAIKGLDEFPYKLQMTPAKNKAELEDTENKSIKWGTLTGATGNYTDSIAISFEMEAMSLDAFTEYLISLIRESMRDLLVKDYIYGAGTNNKVYGITYNAIEEIYTDANNPLLALENGIQKIPVKKRAGAKIYVSQNIFNKITFTKNKNGDYILPVLNGGGFTELSAFRIEVDPYLRDGDFIIGNISQNYKANINKEITLGLDVINYKRLKIYTSHMMVTAVPVPNSFVYGKLQGTRSTEREKNI